MVSQLKVKLCMTQAPKNSTLRIVTSCGAKRALSDENMMQCYIS